jgi:hypothetical protein
MPEIMIDPTESEFALYNALICIANTGSSNDPATKYSMSCIWGAIHSLRTSRGMFGTFTYE